MLQFSIRPGHGPENSHVYSLKEFGQLFGISHSSIRQLPALLAGVMEQRTGAVFGSDEDEAKRKENEK